jgi:hypothetical protein
MGTGGTLSMASASNAKRVSEDIRCSKLQDGWQNQAIPMSAQAQLSYISSALYRQPCAVKNKDKLDAVQQLSNAHRTSDHEQRAQESHGLAIAEQQQQL